jgi:hypothetical protein
MGCCQRYLVVFFPANRIELQVKALHDLQCWWIAMLVLVLRVERQQPCPLSLRTGAVVHQDNCSVCLLCWCCVCLVCCWCIDRVRLVVGSWLARLAAYPLYCRTCGLCWWRLCSERL